MMAVIGFLFCVAVCLALLASLVAAFWAEMRGAVEIGPAAWVVLAGGLLAAWWFTLSNCPLAIEVVK